jgi:hypothetical protein
MSIHRVAFFVLSALVVGPNAAAAQDLQGSRSIAMGGTLRAAPSGDAALLLNPAGMTLHKAYVVNALYQYRVSDAGNLVNVSVVDSATKRIAAGLFYSFMHATPSRTLAMPGKTTFSLEETLSGHETGLALSYPLANLIHLGMTGKYVKVSVEQPEETPAEVQDDGDSGFTMDFGAVLKPLPSLNLGVVYTNAIPIEHTAYSRQLGMGIAYAVGTKFLAEFDAVLDFDRAEELKASYHGGAELFLGTSYAIRGGAMHDTIREATYVTGGLGVVAKKIALDFGLRQMVDGGAETMVAFSVRLFLQ